MSLPPSRGRVKSGAVCPVSIMLSRDLFVMRLRFCSRALSREDKDHRQRDRQFQGQMSDSQTSKPVPAQGAAADAGGQVRWCCSALALLVVLGELAFLSLTGRPLTMPDRITRVVETRLNDGTRVGPGVAGATATGHLPGTDPARADERCRCVRRERRRDRAAERGRVPGWHPSRCCPGAVELTALRVSGAQITVRRRDRRHVRSVAGLWRRDQRHAGGRAGRASTRPLPASRCRICGRSRPIS